MLAPPPWLLGGHDGREDGTRSLKQDVLSKWYANVMDHIRERWSRERHNESKRRHYLEIPILLISVSWIFLGHVFYWLVLTYHKSAFFGSAVFENSHPHARLLGPFDTLAGGPIRVNLFHLFTFYPPTCLQARQFFYFLCKPH